MISKEKLKENLQNIFQQINTTHSKAQLVAVTKTVDASTMRNLYELGVTHLAENRSHILLKKMTELGDIREEITWHFVGPLQRRQVKTIINEIDYLHSLDRLSLANEIQKRAEKPVKCFVQVNISGEETKGGLSPEELFSALEQIQTLDKIKVVGLMTMAPYDAADDVLHHLFKELRLLQEEAARKNLVNMPCKELSMGMSHDYPIALEEGATFIRIGQALFEF